MKEQISLKNNRGASLVLVLVAMMFVGIIASIVLALTVGNSKAIQTTQSTSENFYSAESVLDDLKMYFKKLATASATDAYAATLEKKGSAGLDDIFKRNFNKEMYAALNDILTDSSKVSDKKFTEAFLGDSVTFGRLGDIEITYESIEPVDITSNPGTPVTLKGVKIKYILDGYESYITTDITFKAQFPDTSWNDASENFTYDIDHFIIISNGTINPTNDAGTDCDTFSGNFNGNIFASENFNIKTETSSSSGLNIASQYIIVGNDINAVDGTINITPLDNAKIINSTDPSVAVMSEIWAHSIRVGDADLHTKKYSDSSSTFTDLYLKGNLELNGDAAEFSVSGGKLYAYSYYNSSSSGSSTSGTPTGTADPTKIIASLTPPASSAIILNGLGAKLDLSALQKLNVSGTAYSALSSMEGIYESYNSIEAKPATIETNYYTQGESITYRALQALYLIPGDYIKGVGHNPMKATEFYENYGTSSVTARITSADIIKPDFFTTETGPKLKANVFTPLAVHYINGDDSVYLFWDFETVADAVKYFNQITDESTDKRYKGLGEKQMNMLKMKNGYIKLPSLGNCELAGNGIHFNGTSFSYSNVVDRNFTPENKNLVYQKLMTTLSKTNSSEKPLFDNLFKKGLNTTLANESFNGELTGPIYTQSYIEKDESGNDVEKYKEYTLITDYDVIDPKNPTIKTLSTQKYYLITGSNLTLNASDMHPGCTHIIITPGDVKFNFSDPVNAYKCLIICGGDVYFEEGGLNLQCLGMIQRTYTVKDKDTLTVITSESGTEPEKSEFRALLEVVVDDSDETKANTRLRKIFNVADTSGNAGDGDGADFVTLEFNNWKRN